MKSIIKDEENLWNNKKISQEAIFDDELSEDEEKEIEEIIDRGKPKKVDEEKYNKFYFTYEGDCSVCLNYDYKNNRCKKNMPYINPFYTKDHWAEICKNEISEDCEQWQFIFKI